MNARIRTGRGPESVGQGVRPSFVQARRARATEGRWVAVIVAAKWNLRLHGLIDNVTAAA
jgi:hypothetical protein